MGQLFSSQKFLRLSEAKIKIAIVHEIQIRNILEDVHFDITLTDVEKNT